MPIPFRSIRPDFFVAPLSEAVLSQGSRSETPAWIYPEGRYYGVALPLRMRTSTQGDETGRGNSLVSCDEAGHTKFLFSSVILSWGELWLICPELPLILP